MFPQRGDGCGPMGKRIDQILRFKAGCVVNLAPRLQVSQK